MSAAKNVLDIYNSADKAAQANATLTDPFDLEEAAITGFQADANNKLDWAQWRQFFMQRQAAIRSLNVNMVIWGKQPSPSAQAAAAAAKIAPIAAPTAAPAPAPVTAPAAALAKTT